MTRSLRHSLIAALLCAAAPAFGAGPNGQGNSTTPGSATAGTGGTAAVGGTSATTLGVGATSTGRNGQTASAMGMGASGAAANGTADSRAAVHGNRNLNGQAMARAQDGGTFSKSHTVCHDKAGSDVSCRTKTMAHQPGSKPVMSTTSAKSTVPQ